MSYPPKINAALALLAGTGMWRHSYAPPLHRVLWRAGIPVPPPHLASVTLNTVFFATRFGLVCSIVIGILNWFGQDMSGHATVGMIIFFSALYGVCIALCYRQVARKYSLPRWSSFNTVL